MGLNSGILGSPGALIPFHQNRYFVFLRIMRISSKVDLWVSPDITDMF